ncbi:MAG: biliverdin-producing heme oxygenase [Alphaproteobacteria bacterium]
MNDLQTADAATSGRKASVRSHLRAATATMHDRLHGAPPLARLAKGDLDRHAYAAILQAHLLFHRHMRPAAETAAIAMDLPAIATRSECRRQRIRQDLRDLGVEPRDAPSPPRSTDGFAVGGAYTLLGSAQGGRIIDRRLDTVMPAMPGRSFFRGEAEEDGTWHLFCDRLETYGRQGGRLPALTAGAMSAFAVFRRCLETSVDR